MNRASERKSISGFVLALTLLFAIGALLYRSTINQAETMRWVAHTHEVLARIQELILRLRDAEAGRRGFIMTGRDRYLAHYTNAVERVGSVFLFCVARFAGAAASHRRLCGNVAGRGSIGFK